MCLRVSDLYWMVVQVGAQLDSLCDLVTFGVAPAFLMVKMVPAFTYGHREAVWVIAATYAVCAALRLARFNVETGEEDDQQQRQDCQDGGMPPPGGPRRRATVSRHYCMSCMPCTEPPSLPMLGIMLAFMWYMTQIEPVSTMNSRMAVRIRAIMFQPPSDFEFMCRK